MSEHKDHTSGPDDKVSFGFTEVDRKEKPGLVQGVFRSVATNYDIMNDLMSMGVHRAWKEAMVDWLNPRPGMKFVDVAGGTGDIAFKIADRTRDKAEVIVIDLTPEMVIVGRDRSLANGLNESVKFSSGDALNLALPDSSMDAYTQVTKQPYARKLPK